MFACGGGGEETTGGNGDQNANDGGQQNVQSPKVTVTGSDQLVFASNQTALFMYSPTYTVTGATYLDWVIDKVDIVSFTGTTGLATIGTSTVIFTTVGDSAGRHQVPLRYQGDGTATLTLTPKGATGGYEINAGSTKKVSLITYADFLVYKIDVPAASVPKKTYYDTDIIATLQTHPVWKDFDVIVSPGPTETIPLRISNNTLFSVSTPLNPITTAGTVPVRVDNLAGSVKTDYFDITTVKDKVNKLTIGSAYTANAGGKPLDLLLGIDNDITDFQRAYGTALVLATWDNDRSIWSRTGMGTVVKGQESIPFASFSTGTALTLTKAGGWDEYFTTSGTSGAKLSYNNLLSYEYTANEIITTNLEVKVIPPTKLVIVPKTSTTGTVFITTTTPLASIPGTVGSLFTAGSDIWAEYATALNNGSLTTSAVGGYTKATSVTSFVIQNNMGSGGTAFNTSDTSSLQYVEFTFPTASSVQVTVQIPFKFF